jgi:drug/metabolite transporter (DMT)-like permease
MSVASSGRVRKDHLDLFAFAVLLGCCSFWAFQQVLAKATMAELPPVFQSAVRSMGACLLLMLWCHWRGIALWVRDASLWPGLLAGALFAFEFACIYLALQRTGASRVTTFLYTSPFWVAAILPFFLASERLRTSQWVGLVCAFAGVCVALWAGLRAGGGVGVGDVLALAAGASWGLTTVVIRTMGLTTISAERLLFYQIGVAAITLPILSLAMGETWVGPAQMSGFAITSMTLQTAVGAFASYLVWMWMLGRYPAAKMSAFVFVTPILALLIAAAWLGEPITINLLIAIAGVAIGMILVNRR